MFETISADKARSGERVTLRFYQGGYGVGFVVDGDLYESPGKADWAPKINDGFDIIRDGGETYDRAYN